MLRAVTRQLALVVVQGAAVASRAPQMQMQMRAMSSAAAPQKFVLHMAMASRPKRPETKKKSFVKVDCGEDAFYINEEASSFGVADGVGGWADQGVDPAEYSWRIMTHCGENASNKSLKSAQDILAKAQDTVSRGRMLLGSCTACLVRLDQKTGVLSICNLGDSEASVYRAGQLKFKTTPGQVDFNCPHQLAHSKYTFMSEHGPYTENTEISIEDGDLVMLATDGLTDNLFTEEVGQLVRSKQLGNAKDKKAALKDMLEELVEAARLRGLSTTKDSPFATAIRKVQKDHPYGQGGKPDDVTVVACLFEKAAAQESK